MFERFYQARKGKNLAFGTHCWSADIAPYEMSGRIGYDYVWIDNEHGGMTFPMIFSGIVAANAAGAAAIVRVPGHSEGEVKPILEMGPQGIVFPKVNTAEEAKLCVAHCHYPPFGTRGYGPLRAIDYYEKPTDQYLEDSKERPFCFIQCEHIKAVDNLDEILKVPGVDAVICGPMDLSGSVGKLGQLDDPEVKGYMEAVIGKCRAAGIPFGISVGSRWDIARHWIESGAGYVSVGSMYDFFSEGSHSLLKAVEELREQR